MSAPLYAFYGDDFTGSSDVLQVLASAGVDAVLFLDIPSDEMLARFNDRAAFGIAGDSRSRSPEWMSEHLPGVFGALKALGAPVSHYKVCSTFDSSPRTGSIGRALEIGLDVFDGAFAPVVVGAPHLRRYVAFGTLFAAGGAEVYRIDRHPTMSRHPVTPMAEADLRRHLALQTDLPIASVELPDLHAGRAVESLTHAVDAGARVVVFDGADQATVAATGDVVWNAARRRALFAVGSSGLTQSVIMAWRAEGLITEGRVEQTPEPAETLLVMSGSCSPVTAGQIRHALDAGYESVAIDPHALLADTTGILFDDVTAQAVDALAAGRNVVIYTALGPLDTSAVALDDALGRRMGEMLRTIVERSGQRRILLAGGDTSSHAMQQLGIDALTWAGDIEPGGPLCLAYSASPAFDGLELVLKGGQVGSVDFFERVRRGG